MNFVIELAYQFHCIIKILLIIIIVINITTIVIKTCKVVLQTLRYSACFFGYI